MKLPADNEEEGTNLLQYIDDKMYSLLIAFEAEQFDVLEYLLDRF
jgi:hypothetical protein